MSEVGWFADKDSNNTQKFGEVVTKYLNGNKVRKSLQTKRGWKSSTMADREVQVDEPWHIQEKVPLQR